MNYLTRDTLFDLDTLFNSRFQARPNVRTKQENAFPVDIFESDEAYQLIAELAGINKETIDITVNDGVLTISSEDDTVSQSDNEFRVLRRERAQRKLSRNFKIGEDIAQENISASFDNGLLTLTIPKVKETKAKKQTIKIH